MSLTRLALLLVLFLGAAGLAGALLRARMDRSPAPAAPPIEVEGWTHRRGTLVRTAGGDWSAPEGLLLERDGIAVELDPGAVFDFAGGLPELLDGGMSVRGSAERSFGPFGLLPGSELRFGGEGVVVGGGGVIFDGRPIPPGTIIDRSAPQPLPAPLDRRAAGIVVDAATGAPISGATVRVTFGDQPEGYPAVAPEARQIASTDFSGRFELPLFRPEDPRLRIRVEAEAEGYEAAVALAEEESTLSGEWPFLKLALRRVWLAEVRFTDADGSPWAGATVRVSRPADPYLPEEGASPLREGDREVALRTTDESGRLFIVPGVDSFELIEPALVPYPEWLVRPSFAGDADEDGVDATGNPVPIHSLHILAETFQSFELVGDDGLPVAAATLEIEVPEEARVFRMRTDDQGRFAFGVAERPPDEPQLIDAPKAANLRVLSTEHRGETRELFLPGHPDRIILDGRAPPHLLVRFVMPDDSGELHPFPVEQVRISPDLVPVHRGRDGRAIFSGALPPGGQRVVLGVRGAAPVEVIVPTRPDPSLDLDLGDVVLLRRDPVPVRIAGAPPEDLEGAVLEISGDEFADSRYRTFLAGETGSLGGIDPLRSYRFRITGPWIQEASGEFRVADDRSGTGLAIPVSTTEEYRLVTEGKVLGIPPWETPRYRVIERPRRGDENDPVIQRSYRLAPDGSFGSELRVDGALRFEALILGGSSGRFAHARPQGKTEAGFVGYGALSPEEPLTARFRFRIAGAGPTLPPETWLEAFLDRNEEVVELDDRLPPGQIPFVEARFLLPGEYALRWGSFEAEDGAFPFVVTEKRRQIAAEIEIPAAARNAILITVIDAEGAPVDRAEVVAVPIDPRIGEGEPEVGSEIAPGVYRIVTSRDVANRIRVERIGPDSIPIEVTVPAGGEIAAPFVLPAPASLAAEVRDAAGERIEGVVEVQPLAVPAGEGWPEGTTIRAGATRRSELDHGRLRVSGLASGERRLEIRHVSTSIAAELALALRPGGNETDEIVLTERRTLRGVVLFEGGEGAAGVEVALVDPEAVHRYPGRDPDPARIRRRVDSGAGGVFAIDLAGIGRDEVLSLRATLAGRTPAVVPRVDLDGPPATLFLAEGNELVIAASRRGAGEDPEQDRFVLTYQADDPEEGAIDLGEVLVRDPVMHRDVRPGRYRLEWGSEALPPGIERPSAEVVVAPGVRRNLELAVDAEFLASTATLNGESLARGWVLLTDDPGDPSRLRAAPVRDGRAMLPVRPGTRTLCVSLLPERHSGTRIDFSLGSARPEPLPPDALGRDPIPIRDQGHDLVFELGASIVADPEAWLELPRWVWQRDRWRTDGTVAVRADRPRLVIPLLAPGSYPYVIESRSPAGWSLRLASEIAGEDVTVELNR